MKAEFPKELIVTLEGDGSEKYFSADPMSDLEAIARSRELKNGKA